MVLALPKQVANKPRANLPGLPPRKTKNIRNGEHVCRNHWYGHKKAHTYIADMCLLLALDVDVTRNESLKAVEVLPIWGPI